MTTYSAIPSGDVDPDSPVTTGLITKLRDNPLAQFEGDVSAPAFGTDVIDTAQIVAASVGRSELANDTTTSAGSLSGTKTNFLLNDWALFPMVHTQFDGSSAGVMHGVTSDGGSASNPRFAMTDGGAGSYDVDHRWIIAA